MQKIGTVLLLLGIGIFAIFGGASFLEYLYSPEGPIFIKIAIFSIVGGILLIILASIKENCGKKKIDMKR